MTVDMTFRPDSKFMALNSHVGSTWGYEEIRDENILSIKLPHNVFSSLNITIFAEILTWNN